MWSGSGNCEGGIRAIGAKRPRHDKRLARYKISPLSQVPGPDLGIFSVISGALFFESDHF